MLGKARKFELDRHTVILCTCSCAASASLKSLDVRQILVDEAGMATEPETLIPLVNFSQAEKVRRVVRSAPQAGAGSASGAGRAGAGCRDHACLAFQVVLLGDHKQLRPVVKNEQLLNLGLDRSLFERYRRDAYMLDTQYRMVSPPTLAFSRAPGRAGGTVPGSCSPHSMRASAASRPWSSTRRG